MALQKSVLIVGSINVDCTVNVKKLPKPGETVHGTDAVYLPGGKGGNQAVSVAAADTRAIMISAVGNDSYGKQALETLKGYGVDTAGVLEKDGATGTAFIFVEGTGENLIVVTPGANSLVSANDAERFIKEFAQDALSIVLAQLELPIETVEHAARVTEDVGGRFILNLAPAAEISKEMLASCDPIVVNEYEASFILGREIASTHDALLAAVEIVKRAKSVVITLGSKGAVYADSSVNGGAEASHVETKKVEALDTTGAGDAFVGAMTAALSRGSNLGEAVKIGIVAGTAAVLYFGAQPPRS
jgi:ribokinase